MKWNIVHTEASCGWGGQEIRILTEAQGMIARGHNVCLLCPPDAPIYLEAKRLQVPVEMLPIAHKSVTGMNALRKWLIRNRPQVINTHSSTDSWLVALACRLGRYAPLIIRTRHISAPVPDNFPTRWLYQRATTHIVTTGASLRRQLIEDNGYDPHRITSVPTGIDTRHFTPGDRRQARVALRLPVNATLIGIVATLRSWKGHLYLLDALSRIRDKSVQLIIVGNGPMRPVLIEHIKKLQLSDRVSLVGNQRDPLPWFRALDVFALPSYANEGVPQSIMQAMACGLPVISTPIGSIEEAILHGKTGLVVAPRDAAALAAAFELIIADAKLRQTLATNAEAFAKENFTIEQMIDRMEQVIQYAGDHAP